MEDAEELFGRMQRRDPVSWNVMITGHARAGSMQVAQSLFDEMPQKDTISWTAVMRGYLQNGDVDASWKVFQEMPDRDAVAWNTMIGGFVHSERVDEALRLFAEMPDKDLVSWNTILQGYVQNGDMDSANTWFRRMPEKDETSWNTLISGYKDEGALALLSEMIRGGLRPDQATLSVVISICASLVALGCGKMVHLRAVKTGFEHDALVMSSLISMYSKCGLIAEASQAFDAMVQRDTVTWNAMIATYAYHGMAAEALKLFHRMTEDGFRPDHATFLSVLSACAHKGYLYEGCRYFKSMQEDWNLIPRSDHYSCMVDLLGRSGFTQQAYAFTRTIPSDLQVNAWETLFSACNAHGDVQLGEVIANNVLQAQPSDGGMYTLLSNLYAAKEMWSSAATVRGFMKKQGLKKETGCSWVELKGEVASFSSNDKTHPLIDQICQEVDNLSVMIEEAT
jgi:pentatricopeptide repeat protein